MPLNLDDRVLTRYSDRALHRQLADVIRAAIDRGDLQPGESLPSEGDIAAAVGLSKTPVRYALNILAGEGRIVKRSGTATRVAEPPVVRRMATSRYADELALLRAGGPHPQSSAFTRDHGVSWDRHTVDADYSRDKATDLDAERLGVAPGTPVLRRRFVKYVDRVPMQIQESVLPWQIVAGTPVADPKRQPWPGGTIAELYSVGLVASRVLEEARARTATEDERRALELDDPGMVLEVLRMFQADGRVVEVSVAVVPAARSALRYETDLS